MTGDTLSNYIGLGNFKTFHDLMNIKTEIIRNYIHENKEKFEDINGTLSYVFQEATFEIELAANNGYSIEKQLEIFTKAVNLFGLYFTNEKKDEAKENLSYPEQASKILSAMRMVDTPERKCLIDNDLEFGIKNGYPIEYQEKALVDYGNLEKIYKSHNNAFVN